MPPLSALGGELIQRGECMLTAERLLSQGLESEHEEASRDYRHGLGGISVVIFTLHLPFAARSAPFGFPTVGRPIELSRFDGLASVRS